MISKKLQEEIFNRVRVPVRSDVNRMPHQKDVIWNKAWDETWGPIRDQTTMLIKQIVKLNTKKELR